MAEKLTLIFKLKRNLYLDSNESACDDELRLRADVIWPLGRLGRRVKDPGNAVGLGEQRAVDDGEAHSDAKSLQDARNGSWFHQQHKRVEVTK